jgi:hypothetical protein
LVTQQFKELLLEFLSDQNILLAPFIADTTCLTRFYCYYQEQPYLKALKDLIRKHNIAKEYYKQRCNKNVI